MVEEKQEGGVFYPLGKIGLNKLSCCYLAPSESPTIKDVCELLTSFHQSTNASQLFNHILLYLWRKIGDIISAPSSQKDHQNNFSSTKCEASEMYLNIQDETAADDILFLKVKHIISVINGFPEPDIYFCLSQMFYGLIMMI